MTDHTRTEKIDGDSINFCVHPSQAENRYDICHFISSHNSIAMHFVLVELPRNSLLLTNDHSKRGDVETLARSSVSPSSQIKNVA